MVRVVPFLAVLALCLALWQMPSPARAETPQPIQAAPIQIAESEHGSRWEARRARRKATLKKMEKRRDALIERYQDRRETVHERRKDRREARRDRRKDRRAR